VRRRSRRGTRPGPPARTPTARPGRRRPGAGPPAVVMGMTRSAVPQTIRVGIVSSQSCLLSTGVGRTVPTPPAAGHRGLQEPGLASGQQHRPRHRPRAAPGRRRPTAISGFDSASCRAASPPSALPARAARSSPTTSRKRATKRARRAGEESVAGGLAGLSPGRSGARTWGERPSRASTADQSPALSPPPCTTTSGGPVPAARARGSTPSIRIVRSPTKDRSTASSGSVTAPPEPGCRGTWPSPPRRATSRGRWEVGSVVL
jgi:hypothetical protein